MLEEFKEPIDRKFIFIAANPNTGSLVTQENGVVFKAADNALLPALQAYLQECERLEVDDAQMQGIVLLIERIKQWRKDNPDLCKIPDVGPGPEADAVTAPNEG